MRALSKEPKERHQTALEFVNAVRDAYGLMPGDLMPITPLTPINTDGAPSHPTDGHVPTTKVDRSVTPLTPLPAKSAGAGGSSNRVAMIGLAAVLLLGIITVGYLLFSSTANSGLPGAPIVLYYNDKEFTMHNTGDYTLNLSRLDFVRGAAGDNDDYSGDRVAGDSLPANACARIVDQSEQQIPALPQCEDVQSKEVLNNVLRYFWRREAADGTEYATYEVWYDERLITRCDTVTMGQTKECRFEWPVPPA